MRVEDQRLLSGRGQFLGDQNFSKHLEMVVVRSPHAHADLGTIDLARASGMPGIAGIFTADNLAADGLGPMGFPPPIVGGADQGRLAVPQQFALARERVRYVGDPIAIVVAERIDQGKDAAEAIDIAFTPRHSVSNLREATRPGAPSLWTEAAGNVAGMFEIGDTAAVDAVMATAPHVVRLALINNRIVPNPLEPRVAVGVYDHASGQFTLHACCQAPHLLRRVLAREVLLRLPEDRLRIVVSDMGGGFGARITPYPEEALVLYAARKLRRPVRWQADRSELFLAEYHGRDHESDCALALDADGRILAVRADVLANMGAYVSYFGAAIATHTGNRVATGVYHVPALHIRVRCVLTNTLPTGTYIAAPAGRKRFIGLSVCSTSLRQKSVWIRSNCAGAILCCARLCPIARPQMRPMTAENSPKFSTTPLRPQIGCDSQSVAPRRDDEVDYSDEAWRATSTRQAD